jgi:hypothetical protein
MVVQYQNGYPNRPTIKKLLEKCDVDVKMIQFCADYTIKSAGILWKAHSIDDKLNEFLKFAEDNGIKIARSKFHGQIHSIWFSQQKDKIDD